MKPTKQQKDSYWSKVESDGCRICSSPHYCSYSRDGLWVCCARIHSSSPGPTPEKSWIHWVGDLEVPELPSEFTIELLQPICDHSEAKRRWRAGELKKSVFFCGNWGLARGDVNGTITQRPKPCNLRCCPKCGTRRVAALLAYFARLWTQLAEVGFSSFEIEPSTKLRDRIQGRAETHGQQYLLVRREDLKRVFTFATVPLPGKDEPKSWTSLTPVEAARALRNALQLPGEAKVSSSGWGPWSLPKNHRPETNSKSAQSSISTRSPKNDWGSGADLDEAELVAIAYEEPEVGARLTAPVPDHEGVEIEYFATSIPQTSHETGSWEMEGEQDEVGPGVERAIITGNVGLEHQPADLRNASETPDPHLEAAFQPPERNFGPMVVAIPDHRSTERLDRTGACDHQETKFVNGKVELGFCSVKNLKFAANKAYRTVSGGAKPPKAVNDTYPCPPGVLALDYIEEVKKNLPTRSVTAFKGFFEQEFEQAPDEPTGEECLEGLDILEYNDCVGADWLELD